MTYCYLHVPMLCLQIMEMVSKLFPIKIKFKEINSDSQNYVEHGRTFKNLGLSTDLFRVMVVVPGGVQDLA